MTSTLATTGLGAASAPLNLKSGAEAAAAPAAADSAGMQDRFLKLLVAQMSNQDPMNPMDNAQMTSQIAQINTVTGIQQLNDTMKSIAAQMASMQTMQAGGLVGREVLVEGSRLAIDKASHSAAGALELAGAASSVRVEVTTAGGRVVDTVALGPLSAGQHNFTLDSSAWPADAPLQFRVVAANGAEAVPATPLMRDRVAAVGNGAGGPTLNLQSGANLPYGGVRAVL